MGLFNNDDEDQQLPPPAGTPPVPVPAAPGVGMDPAVAAHVAQQNPALWEKYQAMAGDNSGVQAARDAASHDTKVSGLLQGLSTAFAGRDKTDDNYYNGVRDRATAAVGKAQQDKQQGLNQLVEGDKLQQQGVAQGQLAKDNAVKNDENDGSSDRSTTARATYVKMFPGLGLDQLPGWDNVSAADIKANIDNPLKLKETAMSRQASLQVSKDQKEGMLALGNRKADQGDTKLSQGDTKLDQGQQKIDNGAAAGGAKDETQFSAKEWTPLHNKYLAAVGDNDQAVAMVNTATQAGGGVASTVVPAELAKSIVKRVTQNEIQQFSGDPGTMARLERIWTRGSEGLMTAGDAAEFQKVLNVQRAGIDKTYNQQSGDMLALHAKNTGKNVDDVTAYYTGKRPTAQAPGATVAGAYPKTVKNAKGERATVGSQAEADEASKEGFQ